LSDREIDVSFFNIHGKFRGRFTKSHSKNITYRIKQFELLKDNFTQIFFVKKLVKLKIENSIKTLNKLDSLQEILKQFSIKELNEKIELINNKNTINAIRGIEGISARIYFKAFKNCIYNNNDFIKRIKHPPVGRVNSLLSLGYTFLMNEMRGYIEAFGLDPFIGIFHQVKYGKTALVYDLMEEFRSVVVDDLIVDISNNNLITYEDYYSDDIKLNEIGIKKFITLWEKKVGKLGKGKNIVEIPLFRNCFKNRIQEYMKFLENNKYNPFDK